MEKLLKRIGNRARKLRGTRTQQAVADISGLSRPTIQKIERGTNARIGTLRQLARGLGVSLVGLVR